MMNLRRPLFGILCSALIFFLMSAQAFAVLGQRSDSVTATALGPNAKIKAVSNSASSWTAQDVITDGTTVREYLNSDGIVFAVAWKGVLEPELSSLLGDYYTEYSQAVRATKKTEVTKRNLRIETTRVKVQRSGHMRSWHGLAYLPSLVPTGVSLEGLEL